MPAVLVKGAPLAAAIRGAVSEAVARAGVSPVLVNVVVGDLSASASYLDALDRAAGACGLVSRRVELPADVGQAALHECVQGLAADPGVHGLMLQQPLPAGLDARAVTAALPPSKDVDGLTEASLGAVLAGHRRHTAPATAAAVVEILSSRPELDPAGRAVAIVGRSLVVGRPLAAMLTDNGPGGNATVTVCHTRTADLGSVTRAADIVVVAAGRRHLLQPDMVAPGAVVVDVGTHAEQTAEGKWTLAGDCHPDVAEVAGFLTPVPGGVGPVTTAILMRHVAAAALPGAFGTAW